MTRLWMVDDFADPLDELGDPEPVAVNVQGGVLTLTLWDGRRLEGSAQSLLADLELEVLADNEKQRVNEIEGQLKIGEAA